MGRINSYENDPVDEGDKFIGTNSGGLTKNFTVGSLSQFLKENNGAGVVGQYNYEYFNNKFGGATDRPDGTITINTADSSTLFSSINNVVLSEILYNSFINIGVIIESLIGEELTITNPALPTKRAVYLVNTVVESTVEPGFYNVGLTFIEGDGSIEDGYVYSLSHGKAGAGGDKHYAHTQVTSSTTWNIVHGLKKFPNVTVVDSAGTNVVGEVEYVSNTEVNLIFSGAFSGKAYLN